MLDLELPFVSFRRRRCRVSNAAAAAAVTLMLAGGTAPPARAEPVQALGRFERECVSDALALLGLSVDPSPDGKVIGRIYVVNQDVFSQHDWHFQLLNLLHRTTRSDVIARELLVSPGQPWDAALVDESVRNLQTSPPLFFADGTVFGAPQLSSVIALVPVVSAVPGNVDLLAVTRDVWSLRFNTEFQFQRNLLSQLSTSISENNLFGWRKQLAAGFQMDQGRFGIGPKYFDPNVLGTRLTFLATGTAWYARDSDHYEGDNELFSLRYPLYSIASRWGVGVDVIHQDAVVRHFCDDLVCTKDVVGTVVPFAYRSRILTTDANVVRAFGQEIIQLVTAGYRVESQRSLVLPDFPIDPDNPALANQFLAEWAPLSETRSEPYLRYELFTPRYGVTRDLDTFDLRENRRIGPLVAAEIGVGIPALGADFLAYPVSATAGWAFAPCGSGFGVAQVQASARIRPEQLIDQRLSALLYFASPSIARAARVVVSATADAIRADSYRTRFFLGGDSGLRGYQIGEFQGTVQAVAHAEVRSAPLAVYSQRIGGVVFYDVGHTAESFDGLVPHHDVGVGLRWMIPQLGSSVLRIDWAVATQSGPYTQPGLPGRITAGFGQSFWLLHSPAGYSEQYQ